MFISNCSAYNIKKCKNTMTLAFCLEPTSIAKNLSKNKINKKKNASKIVWTKNLSGQPDNLLSDMNKGPK